MEYDVRNEAFTISKLKKNTALVFVSFLFFSVPLRPNAGHGLLIHEV